MSFVGEQTIIRSIQFSLDEQTLFVADQKGFLRIFSTSSKKLVNQTKLHQDIICQIQLFDSGKFLGSCSKDKFIKIWEVSENKVVKTINASKYADISSIAFSTNNLNH
jgi:WD repeat-containing protein 61